LTVCKTGSGMFVCNFEFSLQIFINTWTANGPRVQIRILGSSFDKLN
jgi:hypothetical protein